MKTEHLPCKRCGHHLTLSTEKQDTYYCKNCNDYAPLKPGLASGNHSSRSWMLPAPKLSQPSAEESKKKIFKKLSSFSRISIFLKKKISQTRRELRDAFVKENAPEAKTELEEDLEDVIDDIKKTKKSDHNLVFFTICLLTSIALISSYFYLKKKNLSEKKDLLEELQHQENYTIEEAEEFALKYLSCSNVNEAISLALPDKHIKSSMEKHWEKTNVIKDNIFFNGMYYADGTLAYFFIITTEQNTSRKAVVFPNNTSQKFYFDWRSYSDIQDYSIDEIHSLPKGSIFKIRISPQKTFYYNYGYKEKDWRSFKIYAPSERNTTDYSMNAYSNHRVGNEIYDTISQNQTTLLVEVKWTGKTLEILEILSKRPTEDSYAEYKKSYLK